MTKFKTLDMSELLRTEADLKGYLAAVMESGDASAVKIALADVARIRGMKRTAAAVKHSRAGLYKALSEKGNPSFKLIYDVIDDLGFTLTVADRPARARVRDA